MPDEEQEMWFALSARTDQNLAAVRESMEEFTNASQALCDLIIALRAKGVPDEALAGTVASMTHRAIILTQDLEA